MPGGAVKQNHEAVVAHEVLMPGPQFGLISAEPGSNAVEGLFLLRGLGFVEFSAKEHRSVQLHAREIVARVLAGRKKRKRLSILPIKR